MTRVPGGDEGARASISMPYSTAEMVTRPQAGAAEQPWSGRDTPHDERPAWIAAPPPVDILDAHERPPPARRGRGSCPMHVIRERRDGHPPIEVVRREEREIAPEVPVPLDDREHVLRHVLLVAGEDDQAVARGEAVAGRDRVQVLVRVEVGGIAAMREPVDEAAGPLRAADRSRRGAAGRPSARVDPRTTSCRTHCDRCLAGCMRPSCWSAATTATRFARRLLGRRTNGAAAMPWGVWTSAK